MSIINVKNKVLWETHISVQTWRTMDQVQWAGKDFRQKVGKLDQNEVWVCWVADSRTYGWLELSKGTDEQHEVGLEGQPGQHMQGLVSALEDF